jgi:CubicO group peptidase (beta-lactamase class C family)
MQTKLDQWARGEAGGVAAAWIDQDGMTFFQSGSFDGANSRPITADTKFEIGSLSKVFTGLLLAESERLGKVSRNDSAAKYLLPADDPDQAALAKITLLSLTTHRSGLPRLPSNIGPNPDATADPYATYDRAMLVRALRYYGATARVGEKAVYSNFGAAVLGEALAAAWGTTYTTALHEHILAPLGMKQTSVGLAGEPPPDDLAPGHNAGKRVPNWTFQAFAPCGAIRSSARDMAVFISAALGQPNSPLRASFRTTVAPLQPFGDTGDHIGMGWMIADAEDPPFVWHNGATAGSHAFMAFSPKQKTGIVILANFQKASEGLGTELLGVKMPKPSIPKHVDLPIATLRQYLGNYTLTPSFVLTITEENDALFAQATGQGKAPIYASAADEFFYTVVKAQISFQRNASGAVTGLTLHQNGRDMPAPKTP